MKLGIITHPIFLKHKMATGHPECPERVQVITEKLQHAVFRKQLNFYKAQALSTSLLSLVHDKTYIEKLFALAPRTNNQLTYLDPDTAMNNYTIKAAIYAAGSVKQAVDLVMKNQEGRIFCSIRPPGHHAERAKAMGFCFFNNVVIGVMYALIHYHLKRVAIIDFDVHQGNGTLSLIKDKPQIFYASSYQHPFYPFTDIVNSEHIISEPIPANTSSGDFCKIYKNKILPQVNAFKPNLIFISAGFDAYHLDPLADQLLTEDDYAWITDEIVKIANKCCGGKIISVLEGGYKLPELGDCVLSHCQQLLCN